MWTSLYPVAVKFHTKAICTQQASHVLLLWNLVQMVFSIPSKEQKGNFKSQIMNYGEISKFMSAHTQLPTIRMHI